jgi:two-component system KDP operon response regulator KdpE
MDTVLILDSDQASRRRMLSAMRYGGFNAESARSLREACRRLRRKRYAALLVDPGEGADASRVVEELRTGTDVPLIAVSECDDQPYKIALLDAGADDYVTRPFDPEELLARLRAVSRRVVQLDDRRPVVTGDLTIHLADRRLLRGEREVALSPTEWKLVEVLVQHASHLVTREELLTCVWGTEGANKPQNLRVHMSNIRHKVEPDPSNPRYFVTQAGLGVLFNPAGRTTPEGAESFTATG